MKITDGTGKGYGAKVDSDHHLQVAAISEDEMQNVSKEYGQAFIVYAKRDFAAGSQTNENIMYFKYTGTTKRCFIKQIQCSTNGTNTKIEVYKNPTYTSGGTATIPLNLNFSSNETANVTAYSGATDITMSVAASDEMYDVRLAISTFIVPTTGLVLGNGDSIGIIGSVATTGEKVRCEIYFYEKEIEL